MVRVKEAVKKAQELISEIFGEETGRDLLLESVELTDASKFWTVIFSSGPPFQREYKTIKLGAQDGEFVGARNGIASTGLL